MAWVEATQFYIYVGGSDFSTRFASRLIRLTVNDTSGESSDTATIELDDTNGSIIMPQEKAVVQIALGTVDGPTMEVFSGVVDDVKHIFDRNAGRRIQVEAKSADMHGKQKEEQTQHNDDSTVEDALKKAGKAAGVEVYYGGKDKSKRKYIAQDNESFLHFAERMSRETGTTFKMVGGNKAVFLDRNGGQTVGGGAIGNVSAVVGKNLITSNISPIMARPNFGKVRARWYDVKKAKWTEETVEVAKSAVFSDSESEDVKASVRYSKDGATEAKSHGGSAGKESDRERGGGTVIIDGNPAARAEGMCTVVGVRPGVDGTYVIATATHELDRSSGYRTSLTLKRPGGKAGSDDRKAGGKGDATDGGTGKSSGTGGADPAFEPIFGNN